MKEKKITRQEFLDTHENKIGFVFKGPQSSTDDAIKRFVNNLIETKVAKVLPDYFVRVGETEVAFIYAADSEFRMADFYQAFLKLESFFNGVFEIDCIYAWIKQQNK